MNWMEDHCRRDIKVEVTAKEVQPIMAWLREQKMDVVRAYSYPAIRQQAYRVCVYFADQTDATLFKLFWMEGHD